jgi:hypothetical protein
MLPARSVPLVTRVAFQVDFTSRCCKNDFAAGFPSGCYIQGISVATPRANAETAIPAQGRKRAWVSADVSDVA